MLENIWDVFIIDFSKFASNFGALIHWFAPVLVSELKLACSVVLLEVIVLRSFCFQVMDLSKHHLDYLLIVPETLGSQFNGQLKLGELLDD